MATRDEIVTCTTNSNSNSNSKKQSHVLVVTVAFAGHFAPFVQLLFHLDAEHPGLTVTVLGNKDRIADLAQLQSNGGAFKNLDLRLEAVFGPIPAYRQDPKFPVRGGLASGANLKECEAFAKKLLAQKDSPDAPTAIVADMFQYWSKDWADELGIPWYPYYSVSPAYAVVILEIEKLAKVGVPPDENSNSSADNSKMKDLVPSAVPGIIDVPGLSTVRVSDIPGELAPFVDFYTRCGKSAIGATAVLLNVSEDMDAPVGAVPGLKALVKSSRVLSIGPSLQHPGFGFIYSPSDPSSKLVGWLDSQPGKSVFYIAFGSVGSVSVESNLELAAGIEASGVSFLWALKPGSRQLSEILPPGFEERTKGRGLVETGWLPQTQILTHPAVGGFLTHCGWNSILESVCAGVPLVAWPISADQPINARFLADIAKIAISVCNCKETDQDSFENITAREVEKSIRLLMLEEEGRQVRANIEAMQKSAQVAVNKGGSSYQDLHTLLDELAGKRAVHVQ